MLYHDRIEFYQAIDVNKASESNKCDICHCWYFLDKGSKFQLDVWHVACYCFIISGISKTEEINVV